MQADDLSALRDEYTHVHDWVDGELGGIGLSPISTGSNVDAKVAIVMQDFSSADLLTEIAADPEMREYAIATGRKKGMQSNKNLDTILESMGMTTADVYMTNAMLFIKQGSVSAPVKAVDVAYSVDNYVSEELEIVDPEVVLCLGGAAFDSLRKHYGVKGGTDSFEANGRRYVKLPHPSPLSVNRVGMDNAKRMYADAVSA